MEVAHGFNKSKIYHSICNTNHGFLLEDKMKYPTINMIIRKRVKTSQEDRELHTIGKPP
jgi:hypothetical protein